MAILQWWESLGLFAQVLYCIAIPSTLILIIQTVSMLFGFGDEDGGDADMDELDDLSEPDSEGVFGENEVSELHDGYGLEGLRIFTVRGIVAFFVVFSWTALAMHATNVPLFLSMPISVICGVLIMLALAYLLKLMLKLRNDGNIDNRNAIGTAGKVYLTVPPTRKGQGKVQIMIQGVFVERDAVTDDEEPIPTGSEIIVVGVSGQTDLVVRKK